MPIVLCPGQGCNRKVTVSESALGGSVRCPYCSQVFRVPAKVEPAAASSPAATLDDPSSMRPPVGNASIPAATLTDIPRQSPAPSTEAGQTLTDPVRATPTQPREPATTVPPAGVMPTVAMAEPPAAIGFGADAPLPSHIGRFEIRQFLGEGAFGVVYRAYDPQLDREVALKVAKPHMLNTEQRVKRFLREAKAAGNLRHPNIVPVHDSGRDGDHYYIASVFIAGQSLAAALEAQPDRGLEARRGAAIVRRLAEALAYAHHRGVVHRDVKPANVMLDEQGEPLLMDFGLAARSEGEEKLTQEAVAMGTPAYMAPEQALGQATAASDQYSLGCTLYELLTGRTPFAGPPQIQLALHQSQEPPSPRKLNRKLPQDLETICLKSLAKAERERYRGCQELADDLRRFLEGEPTHARPLSLPERLWRWMKKEPRLAMTGTAVLALLITLVFVLFVSDQAQRELTGRAEVNAKEAREAEAEAKVQEGKAKEALKAKGIALVAKEEARRNLRALYLSAVAGLSDSDPRQGLQVLDDEAAFPADVRDFAWAFFRRLCQRDRYTRTTRNKLNCVAVAPGDQRVAIGDDAGVVQLWDPWANVAQRIAAHSGPVTAVVFTPDGKVVISAGEDRLVKLWDTSKGLPVATLKGHRMPISCLAVTPRGDVLASGAGEPNDFGELRFWDLGRRAALTEHLSFRMIRCLAYGPDGKRLAGVLDQRTVATWETGSLPDWQPLGDHEYRVFSLALASDGNTLASGCQGGEIKLWDLSKRKQFREIKREGSRAVKALAFAPDGKRLASAGQDQLVHLWDVQDGREISTLSGHTSEVMALAFAPSGRFLASASWDKSVKLWSAAGGIQEWARLDGHGQVYAAAISADSKTLLTAGEDSTVRVWDLATERQRAVLKGHDSWVHALACAPDGPTVASAGEDGTVRLWNLTSEQFQKTLTGHQGPVKAVAFGRNNVLVSGGEDGTWQLWDVAAGRARLRVEADQGPLRAVALTPDGRTLATIGAEGGVKLWDLPAGRFRCMLGKADDEVHPLALAFADDGQTLAASSSDNTVRLWDVVAQRERVTLRGHQKPVQALAYCFDSSASDRSKTLATADQEGVIKLWDAKSGQVLASFRGDAKKIWCLAFAPNRSVLVSGGDDRTAKLWRAASDGP